MKKIHYGWIICICGTIAMFCSVGLGTTGLSVFIPYIREVNGFSNFLGSSIISVRMFSSLISFFFLNKFLDWFSSARCIIIGVFFNMAGFLIWAFAGPNYAIYVIGAILNGLGYTFGSSVIVSVLVRNWFVKRQGLVLSICTAGSSICAFIMPRIVAAVIEKSGMKAAFLTVVLILAVFAAFQIIFIREKPELKGTTPYSPEGLVEKTAVGVNPSSRAFNPVILFVAMVFMGFAANFASGQVANLYRTAGMDEIAVSKIVSYYGLFLLIGKIIFGQFSDKKGCRTANTLFSIILCLGFIGECAVGFNSVWIGYITQFIIGLGLPISTVGLSNLARSCFTADSFARMYKRLQIGSLIGGVFSGIVPGALADVFDSYVPGAMIALLGTIIFFVISSAAYKKAEE